MAEETNLKTNFDKVMARIEAIEKKLEYLTEIMKPEPVVEKKTEEDMF